jgi:hypothetical protein
LRLVGGRFSERVPPECHIQEVWSILPIFAAATEKVRKDHNAGFLNGESSGVPGTTVFATSAAPSAFAMMPVQQNAAQSRHYGAAEK